MTKTPDSIKSRSQDYATGTWAAYTIFELGMWVHLLLKRAGQGSSDENRDKDLYDTQNYLTMMQVKLDSERGDRC
jgi:hypothetical protein